MKYQLLFDQPSMRYDEGLPLGNGRLGAVVTGGLQEKHILLNEETVWYGGPRDRTNPDAIHYIGRIREHMRQGNVPEAQRLALLALTGVPESQRHYTTLGMLVLDFFNRPGTVEDYRVVLDFDSAVATESCLIDGVAYELTAFASAPDAVIAVRLRAAEPVLRFSAGIERGERIGNFSYGTHMDETVRCDPLGLVMRGTCGGENGLRFRAALFATADGSPCIIGDKLVFENAAEVCLYIAAGTDYEHADIEARCVERCRAAAEKGFEACLADHLAEWRALYAAASLDLRGPGVVAGPLPMNRVFDAFAKEDLSGLGLHSWQHLDDYLVLLLFAFGRYLLLSASRACALPANLQGIWCRDLLSIWDGKYTTNINLQMTYWPVDSANLSACFEPYLRHAERIRENGLVTARRQYGCRGFVLHNNTDIWADTAVQDAGAHCSYWFTGGVWIAVDLWEHYRYTLDLDFLARAWPVMRDALLFVLDFMEEEDGQLVMGVTSSPESAYYTQDRERVSFCRMSAMDSQLIGLLMRDCLEAVDVLQSAGRAGDELPAGFVEEVRAAAQKLAPPKIGPDGTILEWGFEAEEVEPGHRHHSHVIGAYPYHAITAKDADLYAAVRRTIEKKIRDGGANTGWSRAWAGGLMARLGDGSAARDLIAGMARLSGQPNLFSICNLRIAPKLMEDNRPMQVEGNLGAVQAVVEMLLHSHDGEIVLLPALPESWREGSFTGLVARGGIVIDAAWEGARLTHARLAPRVDADIVLHTGPGYLLVTAEGPRLPDDDGRIRVRLCGGRIYFITR